MATPRRLIDRVRRTLPTLSALSLLLASPAWADCRGMVVHAHRGAPAQPENSLSAVRAALAGDWDGVEIDMQQLASRRWVLHHDLETSRTTSLQRRSVSQLDDGMWREIRLKGRDGRITSEPPPFLDDVLREVSRNGGKVLNAEIKQTASCQAIQVLMDSLSAGVPQGNWFLTSISRSHLQCARQKDPQGYLGLIVLDPRSLASQDQRTSRWSGHLANTRIDRAWLQTFIREVGSPAGVHVDDVTLSASPDLLAAARELGVSVFTYSLRGDRQHADTLSKAAKRTGLLPSGAIIDAGAKQFCSML